MVRRTTDAEGGQYRRLIDELVSSCRRGQGQIGPRRVRAGIWRQVTRESVPSWMREVVEKSNAEDESRNRLLEKLSAAERRVLARLLAETFQGGVHETLVTLHENQVPPFDRAYEGTPFHDFVGRLDGWKWPRVSSRS